MKKNVQDTLFDKIKNALLEKKVQLTCQACSHNTFSLLTEIMGHLVFSRAMLAFNGDRWVVAPFDDHSKIHSVPFISIVCDNCGYVIQHSLEKLVDDLMDLSDTDIEDKVDISQFEETVPPHVEPPSRSQKTQTKKKYKL